MNALCTGHIWLRVLVALSPIMADSIKVQATYVV